MYLKWHLKMALTSLKQELHITQARKFGEMSHMTSKVIYGRWDVFCMKWSRLNHLSKLPAWKVCLKEFVKVKSKESIKITQ